MAYGHALEFPLSAKLVHFQRHGRLLMCCLVLVDEPLGCRAVNCLDSNFIGTDGCVTVAFGNSRIKLLQLRFQGGLVSLVLRVLQLGLLVSLHCGLDVRHFSIATSSYKIQSISDRAVFCKC